MNIEKHYLGDGVYASFDGFHLTLTTQEGNIIFLDSEVYTALVKLAQRLKETHGYAIS